MYNVQIGVMKLVAPRPGSESVGGGDGTSVQQRAQQTSAHTIHKAMHVAHAAAARDLVHNPGPSKGVVIAQAVAAARDIAHNHHSDTTKVAIVSIKPQHAS
eukprot:1185775-Prorocentrum_minimum.AAC.1